MKFVIILTFSKLQLLKMSFGDWEMFKATIYSLRDQEFNLLTRQEELKLGRTNKERKGE